jgi:hypothetical protein
MLKIDEDKFPDERWVSRILPCEAHVLGLAPGAS